MTWDFCAEPNFRRTFDWLEKFFSEHPRRALEPLKQHVFAHASRATRLRKEVGGNGLGQLPTRLTVGRPRVAQPLEASA